MATRIGTFGSGVVAAGMLGLLFAATAVLGAAPSANPLKFVDWRNAVVPASVCGGQGSVRLHDSYGLVSSQRWPDAWNSEQPAVMANQVQVGSSDPVRYGAVMADGRPEALVPIWCTNGGGTADGQLGQGLVVYHESRDGPAVTGIITTGQSNDHTMAYFGDAATRIERGRIRVKPPRTRTVVAAQTDGRERACGWGSATRVARRRYSEGCLREVSRDPVEAIPEARRRWLEDLFRRAGPMSAPEVEERERQAGPERRVVPRAAERP